MLLDENRLQRAIEVKAQRRKAAQNSVDRRQKTKSSIDQALNSALDGPIKRSAPHSNHFLTRRRAPEPKARLLRRAAPPPGGVDADSASVASSKAAAWEKGNRKGRARVATAALLFLFPQTQSVNLIQ